jgi:septal ring factor EnvC (AmiA/AmiB activator)
MNPAPDERDRIRAAMDRILSGTAEHSSGALTIVALALEARVPRNALTQRHTDLKAEFYTRVAERGEPSEVETRLRATIAVLKKTIANKNAELARLRADVPALVRTVNQLTLENQELREALANPSAEVIPIRGRQSRHAED